MSADLILVAMLRLEPFALDRADTLEERIALYRPVAEAIAAAARSREESAFLVADGWHESRFARAVLLGHCEQMPRGMRCDPDRVTGAPRARGPWQVWGVACQAPDLTGQARCVLGAAKAGMARCGDVDWSAGFGSLSGSRRCVLLPGRVQTMRRILADWGKR